jgi:predicted alpha/beta hydrolase family esterase
MHPVLLVPGINNSGPDHWQSIWQRTQPHVARVVQRDWDNPVCAEWVEAIESAVAVAGGRAIIAAHSLGCLAVAHWAAQFERAAHGLLLVAVPDPEGAPFPSQAHGFAPVPSSLGSQRVTVVGSANDPYSSADFTRRIVAAWDADYVELGAMGHINAESGLGAWDGGWEIVRRWRQE